MTEKPEPTPEELALEKAKEAAAVPPEPIPDAEGLPDDVRDGEVPHEDDGSTVDHHEGD